MSVKKYIVELLLGCSISEEYERISREFYEKCIQDCGRNDMFCDKKTDEKIIEYHVKSRHTMANVYKVMSRMLLTKTFIMNNLQKAVHSCNILNVGGSSGIFFDVLEIEKNKGVIVNVLEDHVARAVKDGYQGHIVRGEVLPFDDDKFDYCFSFQCLEHTYNPLLHLKEMMRVTKKGIFISVPYRNETIVVEKKKGHSPFEQHIFEFSPGDLERVACHCGLVMRSSTVLELESKGKSLAQKIYYNKVGWGKPTIFLAYFENETGQ